ncbi:MAG TPA: GNAT family N-acetyltransferase [Candidatus Limnocylindrales bacterium]|nr:GNAT family N-acetyltransferase [Candidatus Limnocylindrales bacterium]
MKILSEAEGEPHTVEEARARDERWDHRRYEKSRVVAQDEEGVVVGYGEVYQEPSRFEPGRYFIRLAVEERWRGRGIGAALWEHLAAELDERRARIACAWADESAAAREFLEHRGFRVVIKGVEQVLELAAFDPSAFAGAIDRVRAQGIVLADLSTEAARDEDAHRKAHGLSFAARTDQPTLGQVTAAPYADWLRTNVESPQALPDGYAVAMDAGRYVGSSSLLRISKTDVRAVVTAVLPSHRRRGIALALKLMTIAYARAIGAERITTSVAEPNVAMLALNVRLGFRRTRSWAGYERECVPV